MSENKATLTPFGRIFFEQLFSIDEDEIRPPENDFDMPRAMAEREHFIKGINNYIAAGGKQLLTLWKQKLRAEVARIFTTAETASCGCPVCQQLMRVKVRADLMGEAILETQKMEQIR